MNFDTSCQSDHSECLLSLSCYRLEKLGKSPNISKLFKQIIWDKLDIFKELLSGDIIRISLKSVIQLRSKILSYL